MTLIKRVEELRRLEGEALEASKTAKRVYERVPAKELYDKLRLERLKLETELALNTKEVSD